MRQFRLDRITRRWLTILQEEMQSWISDLMKDALDPAKIMSFIQGMRIDISQLSGAVGQLELDPYMILGLDRKATDEEVKKRCRALLFKLHPDTCGIEGTNFLVQMILTAYKTIERERGWH